MNIIHITVSGPSGCGKSAVLEIIETALMEQYGIDTQIASHELSYERRISDGDVIEAAKKSGAFGSHKDRVFVLSEAVSR